MVNYWKANFEVIINSHALKASDRVLLLPSLTAMPLVNELRTYKAYCDRHLSFYGIKVCANEFSLFFTWYSNYIYEQPCFILGYDFSR